MPRQTRSPHPYLRLFLALVLALTVVARAEAQQLAGSLFPIGGGQVASTATGFDGAVVLTTTAMGGDGPARTLWYAGGAPPALGDHLLSELFDVYETEAYLPVVPLRRGDYIAAWSQLAEGVLFDVKIRRLDPEGRPVGLETVIASEQFFGTAAAVAPHGDGFVVVWSDVDRLMARAFDRTSTPLGAPFQLADEIPNGPELFLRPLPNGGLLVVFNGLGASDESSALVLGPDLVPIAPPFDVTTSFLAAELTVSPDGSVAALIGRPKTAPGNVNELWMHLFALDGSAVTDVPVRTVPGGEISGLTGAFGEGGALLVLWGERTSGVGALNGRLFDQTGAPIGPIVAMSPQPKAQNLRITRRHDGRFFTAWRNGEEARGAIVSICAAGTSLCGDGALSTTCEACDAGAANSDLVPDACRTDCRPARCGDSVTDSNETCDDGNRVPCDGCNEVCELELGTTCGDGVLGPIGCGEQCDDANGNRGDGCTPACIVERAVGGGSQSTDCFAGWQIDNPSNEPRYDKHGFISGKQMCRDNDPACDFDGGVTGACAFHVGVCANNSEPSACAPARLQSWTLRSPSEKQGIAKPALGAVRAALAAAVLPNVVGSGDADDCSPPAAVVVPLRGKPGAYRAGKLTLKTVATIYNGAIDKDALLLRCDP